MLSDYVGSELELFADATRWKAYWAALLSPYLGTRVVDVGAGLGTTAKAFTHLKFTRYLALEPDVALAAQMRDGLCLGKFAPTMEVMAGSSQDLRAEDQFDTALYVDVLEHIDQDGMELQRIARHLVPGGRIIVLSPAHQYLYSEFDRAIGHVRRYNRRTLLSAKPDGFEVERLFYVDSIGMLASLANRLVLKASAPTPAQIRLWDRGMVPVSRLLDPLLGFHLGKSIIAVYRKPAPTETNNG